MKKLLLFIHGLGGNEKTWGNFPEFIKHDTQLNGFDVKIYEYPTSLIRSKNIVSIFNKPLSWIVPQTKLPKIQEIAQGLKTEIEHRYKEYSEIYLITHSMGGLVAKKYLIDEIRLHQRESLRVKKLLLYAVPNNGSNWADISKVYNHQQIEQLGKSNDFIEFLNTDSAILNLEKYVDMLYVIGTQDKIVDKQSSQAVWGNKKLETLHKGHMDIVKPEDSDDLSYIVFRNFVLKDVEVKKITDKQKVKNSNNNNINFNTTNTTNQTIYQSHDDDDNDRSFNKLGVIATVIGTIVAIIALILSFNTSTIDDSFIDINDSIIIIGGGN